MGPRAGLEWCGKSHPQPGFDPKAVQPVVSRYTDGAILAHVLCRTKTKQGNRSTYEHNQQDATI